MADIGKLIVIVGLIIVGGGLLLSLGGRVPFIGKLPGDILIKRGNFTFYFPLVTSIIVSILLSLILSVLINRR